MRETLIIIPTYNEKENLEKLISEVFLYASDVNILIVDDDSTDDTDTIADKIAEQDKRVSVMHRMTDRGRGLAGIDAFREALEREDIDYIMEMDADFSHDPKYIQQFLKEIKQNDIIIGSRFVKGGRDVERDILRKFLSKAANLFIRRYLRLKIKDCSSGYRCFKRHVIASLNFDSLISKGPAIIEETLYISNLKRFRIKEMPILFKQRYKGKTKLNFIKLSRVFLDILRFKNLHLSKGIKVEELRRFGFNLALALNILGFIMFYRGRGHFIWFTGIGSLDLIFAIIYPEALVPIKRGLDFVILLIGRLINAISLATVFYSVFAPIGLLLRLIRKDLLHQRIDKTVSSYWIKKKQNIFLKRSYERMG